MWQPTLLEIIISNGRNLVNKNGDKMPPCLVPLRTQNGLDWVFSQTTEACWWEYQNDNKAINHSINSIINKLLKERPIVYLIEGLTKVNKTNKYMATSTNSMDCLTMPAQSIVECCLLKPSWYLSWSLYDKTLQRMIFFPKFCFQHYTVQLLDRSPHLFLTRGIMLISIKCIGR